MDDKTRIELEAATFRRLRDHLRAHTEVQNIDLMNLAGFCRNCLANWYQQAAEAKQMAQEAMAQARAAADAASQPRPDVNIEFGQSGSEGEL